MMAHIYFIIVDIHCIALITKDSILNLELDGSYGIYNGA